MSLDESALYDHRGVDVARLVGLSDGLFATVLTLLVLELRLPSIPGQSDAEIFKQIVQLWPKLFSYLLTFAVTALFWVSHHRDFRLITGYNRLLLWLNLMFLLCVGLLPFTTSLVGDHRTSFLIWTVYALDMLLIGLMQALLWLYAVTHNLVDPQVSQAYSQINTYRHLLPSAAFLLSIVVAYFNVLIAPYILLLMFPAQTILRFRLSRLEPSQNAPENQAVRRRELLWLLLANLPLLAFAVWSVYVLFVYGN